MAALQANASDIRALAFGFAAAAILGEGASLYAVASGRTTGFLAVLTIGALASVFIYLVAMFSRRFTL